MESQKPGTELLADLADRITKALQQVVPDTARPIAESIALEMAADWGGQLINFPKGKFVLLSKRDREIYAAFTGNNIKDLVRVFGVSEQHVYRIIKAMRARDLTDRHGDLFPIVHDDVEEV